MNDFILEVLVLATILAVIITSLVEVVKHTVNVPKRALPIIGLALGLVVGALSYPFTSLDLTMRLWAGAFSGLGARGFFEIAKFTKLLKGEKKNG